jgi:uncharacterized protein (TIGR03086 family)
MDVRALDRAALDLNVNLLSKLSEDDYAKPTPCTEWDVRALLGHLVSSNLAFEASALRAEAKPRPEGDLVAAYRTTGEQLTEAFEQEGFLERDAFFPGMGTRPGREIIAAHFVDHLVHAWDLSKAVGLDPTLPEDLATIAYKMSLKYPDTAEFRTGPHAVFAPIVQVPEDAPVTDRLVGQVGRSPDWKA